MKITSLKTENLASDCITDEPRPRFSFTFASKRNNAELATAKITVGDWSTEVKNQVLIPYGGDVLKPCTKYTVTVTATDNFGESDTASMQFETGRMGGKWLAKWITDKRYKFKEKKISPVPMVFRKKFTTGKPVESAVIRSTAMGIYKLELNGKKVGNDYFAPGFTSYKTTLQYQTYDVTNFLCGCNELIATVAGGWAVGSFVFTRKNRITADRQALLLELCITYKDGTKEVVATDESWDVTLDGCVRVADFYDGETYDATVSLKAANWRKAGEEKLKVNPAIIAEFGSPVRVFKIMKPVACNKLENGDTVYDFGQNFAGVICAEINGKRGQKIVFRHSEVLKNDGSLFTEALRSAKATAIYVCRDGRQSYSPEFTYMGFRFVGVSGVEEGDIELSAYALSSDIETNGSFECSDDRINRLQKNIFWSAKSNFMDIPTDCPQRDERMGWTGDISVFAKTACYNFDMSVFLGKWLNDVKSEQRKSGGIPNTVPVQGYRFPATMPVMAIDFWGDACITVPWAEYLARGDRELLVKMYPVMKRYVKACKFWANFFSLGKRRYVWHTPATLHFGDWVNPDGKKMSDWQKRSKWTATASLFNTSKLLSEIAGVLGKKEDERYYKKLSEKVADAYVSVFTDGNGKMKTEFQTAYVLPLAFGMLPSGQREKAADNLVALVKRNGYCIGTGFPGTPYVLFALLDNGKKEEAFKMLFNENSPSWLYEVKAGATTIWELWDALRADGSLNGGMEDGRGGMISFNHYASGAVGDFLYRRIAGIEPTSGGYKIFKIQPVLGGGLTFAKGEVNTPYGKINSEWRIENGRFGLKIQVPPCTRCTVFLPDGKDETVGSGNYAFECKV